MKRPPTVDADDRADAPAARVRGATEAARETQRLAALAADATGRGIDAVTRVMAHMDSIEDATRKIRDIVAIIDTIALQTNILAINASVEAARAGEHGLGFAVVASEVRSLSVRCAESARGIKAVVAAASGRVAESAQAVDEVAEAIADINGSVAQVNRLMEELVAAGAAPGSGITRRS